MPAETVFERTPRQVAADRACLKAFLQERCFISGTFRLASGGTSSVYFDCKRATLDPEGLGLVADLMLDKVQELRGEGLRIDAVGGPSVGADPIAAGMALRSHQRGDPLPAFLVRRVVKDHGTGRRIENDIPAGASVLVVEDVITSGGSVKDTLAAILEAGLQVAAVACIVDREAGGTGALAPHRLVSLFTRSELES
jgi:orotate phosphoribosyltransferase